MGTPSVAYGEIEIGLHRVQPEAYEVELRVTDPSTEGEIAPARGQARISLDELQALHYAPLDYGQKLTDQLFQEHSLREFYGSNKAACDAQRKRFAREKQYVGFAEDDTARKKAAWSFETGLYSVHFWEALGMSDAEKPHLRQDKETR